MNSRLKFVYFLIVLFFIFPSPVSAQVRSDLHARLQNGQIKVDHNNLYLFDQIPDQYIVRARNIKVVFSDRSVGANIDQALDCFDHPDWKSSPASCRRDYVDVTSDGIWNSKTFTDRDYQNGTVPNVILFDSSVDTNGVNKYDRSNWIFEYRAGSWNDLTDNYLSEMIPAFINTNDIVTYQFSYLNTDPSLITENCGYFVTDRSACNNSHYQNFHIGRIQELEQQYPDKAFIYWTTSLERTGFEVLNIFNDQMRNYTEINHKILFDFADIESHRTDGSLCYDNYDGVQYCMPNGNCENNPDDSEQRIAVCREYVTELNGGHLGSVSGGKIRIGKAFWLLMAQIAGWDPDNVNPPSNQAPIVNIGTDILDLTIPSNINITPQVNDDYTLNQNLTYNWTIDEPHQGVVIVNENSQNTEIIVNDNAISGVYTLRLVVSDGEMSSFDTVNIGIIDNSDECLGDYDNNQLINIQDILEVLNNWGSDFGINDLLKVLNNWGNSC